MRQSYQSAFKVLLPSPRPMKVAEEHCCDNSPSVKARYYCCGVHVSSHMHLYMGPGTYPLTRQQRARRMEGSKHLSHPFFFASVHSKLHKPLATGQCHAGPLSVTDFVSWVVAALPGARAMAFGNHRANSVRLGVHSPQSPSANVCLGKQCLSLSCTPQASRGPLSRKGAHIARVCVVACVPGSVVAAEGARKGRGTGVVARVEAAGAGDRARAVAGRHRYRCRWLRASRPPRKFGWAVPIVCNARRSMLCMIKTLMTADLGQGRRHHKGGNRGGPRCVRGARTRQVERAGLDDRGQAPAGAVVVGLTSLARAQCQRCRQQRQADRPHAASRPAAPHHAAAPPASLLSPRSGRVVTSFALSFRLLELLGLQASEPGTALGARDGVADRGVRWRTGNIPSASAPLAGGARRRPPASALVGVARGGRRGAGGAGGSWAAPPQKHRRALSSALGGEFIHAGVLINTPA